MNAVIPMEQTVGSETQASDTARRLRRNSAGKRLVDDQLTGAELNYSVMMHLSALLGLASALLLAVPLVMWLVRRQDSQFIDDHGRDLVNFGLSLLIYALALSWIDRAETVVQIVGAVNVIRAASAAYYGEYFRYPITIRFLS